MADTTFIYELIDPRTGQTRYVGKTDFPDKRLSQHLIDPYNEHKRQWIKELAELSLSPTFSILAEVPYDEWASQEVYWINKKKDQGCNLLNIHNGTYPRANPRKWAKKINIEPYDLRTMLLEKGIKSNRQASRTIGISAKKANDILNGQALDQITIIKLAIFLDVPATSLVS